MGRGAFSLVELMGVLALAAVLAALSIGAASASSRRASVSRARSELCAIASALETYRLAFGDYPRTSDPAILLRPLVGKMGPTQAALAGRCCIEMTRFTTIADLDPFTDPAAQLSDPWGQPYFYAYRSGSEWTRPAYVLFSSGPDGIHAELLSGGRTDELAPANLDNVLSGSVNG
jgi:type II secretory pathway pseudopilin PulG